MFLGTFSEWGLRVPARAARTAREQQDHGKRERHSWILGWPPGLLGVAQVSGGYCVCCCLSESFAPVDGTNLVVVYGSSFGSSSSSVECVDGLQTDYLLILGVLDNTTGNLRGDPGLANGGCLRKCIGSLWFCLLGLQQAAPIILIRDVRYKVRTAVKQALRRLVQIAGRLYCVVGLLRRWKSGPPGCTAWTMPSGKLDSTRT